MRSHSACQSGSRDEFELHVSGRIEAHGGFSIRSGET
jgi:hypothetical protein